MSDTQAQVWKGAALSVAREAGKIPGVVILHFSGPFTARDMFNTLTPDALDEMFDGEARVGEKPTSLLVVDLSEVPYMLDSMWSGNACDAVCARQGQGSASGCRRHDAARAAVAGANQGEHGSSHGRHGGRGGWRVAELCAPVSFAETVQLHHKHGHARAEHGNCGDAYNNPSQSGAGLALHELLVGCHDQDSDEKKRRQQAVDDGRPIERTYRS